MFVYPFSEILFYCLATSIDLPLQFISVPPVRYLLVFDLIGLLCSKQVNERDKGLLPPCTRENLDWHHNKVDGLL